MPATSRQIMNEVVDYGSWCACGSWVLVCPHNVVGAVNGKPKRVAKATAAFDSCGISEGSGCDGCAQVPLRLGEREHCLSERVFSDLEGMLRQRQRVALPPGRGETFVRPSGFANPH